MELRPADTLEDSPFPKYEKVPFTGVSVYAQGIARFSDSAANMLDIEEGDEVTFLENGGGLYLSLNVSETLIEAVQAEDENVTRTVRKHRNGTSVTASYFFRQFDTGRYAIQIELIEPYGQVLKLVPVEDTE